MGVGLNTTNLNTQYTYNHKNGLRKLNDFYQKESFTNIRNKPSGAEPGFYGQKQWTEKDEDKVLNPENPHFKKYQNKAEKWIGKKLQERELNPVKQICFYLGVDNAADLKPQHIQEFIKLVLKPSPEMRQPVLDQACEELKRALKRTYIVKLDYADPLPGTETVMIPLERAKSPWLLGKWIHQRSTAATRRDKNFGAVMEALANDVYKTLKLESQDLCIRKTNYGDGHTKLLLESKFVEGEKGEKFAVLEQQIQDSIIPGSQLSSPEDGSKVPIKDLGRQKIKALLLGDRDKVGRNGDNIGYIVRKSKGTKEAVFQNIDPGKSLEPEPDLSQNRIPSVPKDKSLLARIQYVIEKIVYSIEFYLAGRTDAMTHHNIHTDFSIDQHVGSIPDLFKIAYDNFSIFDDTLLSEKMVGVREILEQWDEIEDLFKEYRKAFSKGEINFAVELDKTWKRLEARKLYIEELFKERLKLTSKELDFLDNMEKLTSKTTDHAGSKQHPIPLNHLRVIPCERKEWHLTAAKDRSSYTFSFYGRNRKEADTVMQRLEQFCLTQGISLREAALRDDSKIEVHMTKEQFNYFLQYFTENEIAAYKRNLLP